MEKIKGTNEKYNNVIDYVSEDEIKYRIRLVVW